MFNNFFEERKLINKLAEIERKHEKFKITDKYKKLSAKEKWEEDQCFFQVDYHPTWVELEEITSKKLLRKASRLCIPFITRWADKEEKFWSQGPYGENYLTIEGKHELIKAIREEERARNEALIWWLPVFSALISAISVICGFFLGVNVK